MYFVRTAGERDLPAIRALLIAAYEKTYTPLHGAEKVAELNADWNSAAVVLACVKDPAGEFLVADDGKQIGGVAYAAPSRQMPKTASLVRLYVHPDHRRQGIGESLLTEVEGCFPQAERLRLEVDKGNEDALAFYRVHGFQTVGETANCGTGQSGIAAFIMEKALTPQPF